MVPRSDGGVNSAAVIIGLGDLDRFLVNFRRQIDQIVIGRALDVERRRLRRNRLRLRGLLTGHGGGGHRLLLDRPDRFAGDAIEHIEKGLLGHLRHCLDRLAVDGDVDQVRRCRRVVIPKPVMHELEVPDLLAGGDIEADQALAIEAVARTIATVKSLVGVLTGR